MFFELFKKSQNFVNIINKWTALRENIKLFKCKAWSIVNENYVQCRALQLCLNIFLILKVVVKSLNHC